MNPVASVVRPQVVRKKPLGKNQIVAQIHALGKVEVSIGKGLVMTVDEILESLDAIPRLPYAKTEIILARFPEKLGTETTDPIEHFFSQANATADDHSRKRTRLLPAIGKHDSSANSSQTRIPFKNLDRPDSYRRPAERHIFREREQTLDYVHPLLRLLREQ